MLVNTIYTKELFCEYDITRVWKVSLKKELVHVHLVKKKILSSFLNKKHFSLQFKNFNTNFDNCFAPGCSKQCQCKLK